jgi:hypothetical protein
MLASDILDLTFFPVGSILMRDGGWTDGRGGWYICDGRATPYGNTPNLKDKFIRGGTTNGTTGGADSNSVTLTANNLPTHSHAATGLSLSGLSLTGLTAESGGGHEHTLTGGVVETGAHTHTLDGEAESDGSHEHTLTGGTTSVGNHSHNTHTGQAAMMIHSSQSYSGVLSTSHSGPSDGNAGDTRGTRGTLTISAGHTPDGGHEHSFSTASRASSSGAHTHDVSGTAQSGGGHSHAFTNESRAYTVAAHTHTVSGSITGGSIGGSTANAGSGQAFSVSAVPPYYTMVYIKKMA